jgi:hypothetical protein
MADSVDVPKIIENATPEQLRKFEDAMKRAKERLGEFNQTIEDTGSFFQKFQDFSNKAKENLDALGDTAKKSANNFSNYSEALSAASFAALGASTGFEGFAQSFSSGIAGMQSYRENYQELIKMVESGGAGGPGLLEKLTGSKILGAVGDISKESMKAMLEEAKNYQALQATIFETAGKTGQLGKIGENYDFSQIEEKTSNYMRMLQEMRSQTNLTTAEANAHFKSLMQIPGALDMVVNNTSLASGKTSQFGTALVEFSRGSKIPIDTLNAQIGTLRDSFNFMTEGEGAGNKSLEFLAAMSEASNKLKLDFDKVKDSVNSIAENFKYSGSVTNDVVNNFYQLSSALEKTGLSAKNSGELAKTFIGGIGQMSEAQKAFISQSTGGAGGAQGIFQMELLERQNKSGEVFNKVIETLRKQVGQRVVSIDEAAGSQEAATERLRQQQITQQLFGVKDSAQAGRILDALDKMQKEPDNLDSRTALENILKQGEKDKEKSVTAQTVIKGEVENIRLQSQVIAYNTTQMLLSGRNPGGAGGQNLAPIDPSTLDKYRNQLQEWNKSMTLETIPGGKVTPEQRNRDAKATVDFGKSLGPLFEQLAKDSIGKAGAAISSAAASNDKNLSEKRDEQLKQIMERNTTLSREQASTLLDQIANQNGGAEAAKGKDDKRAVDKKAPAKADTAIRASASLPTTSLTPTLKMPTGMDFSPLITAMNALTTNINKSNELAGGGLAKTLKLDIKVDPKSTITLACSTCGPKSAEFASQAHVSAIDSGAETQSSKT